MKKKQWLKYLFYMVIILIIVILRVYIEKLAQEYYSETLRMKFHLIFLMVLINVMIGIWLGLEHLIREIKTDGIWKINLPKLIILGLPSLYCTISNFSIYSSNKFMISVFTKPLWKLLSYDVNILSIVQLILGYVIITSFYKDTKESRVDSY